MIKNVIPRTITYIVIPVTPVKAKNLNLYIFFTKVKGNYKTVLIRSINSGLQ